MSDVSAPAAPPVLHHVTLKTTRLAQMRDWYRHVLEMRVTFQFDGGAWLTNDRAHHRIALITFAGLQPAVDQQSHAGLHHSAFEYASFEDLNALYLRLESEAIVPAVCLDHGMSFSYYYADPDGNLLELQCDTFGDWDVSSEWMATSPEFAENPVGIPVDPARVAAAAARGLDFPEIRRLVRETTELAPDVPPDLGMPATAAAAGER